MSKAVLKIVNPTNVPLSGVPIAMGKDADGNNVGGITNAEGIAIIEDVPSGTNYGILKTGFKVYFGTLGAPDANDYIEQKITLQPGAISTSVPGQMLSWIGKNIFNRNKGGGPGTGGPGTGGPGTGGPETGTTSGSPNLLLPIAAYFLLS